MERLTETFIPLNLRTGLAEKVAAVLEETGDGALKSVADTIRGRLQDLNSSRDNKFREAAKNMVDQEDLCVDDDAPVSTGDEGAYVQAWTWVSNEDAGIEPKRKD